jgi:superfamily II DNA or RNA helicase
MAPYSTIHLSTPFDKEVIRKKIAASPAVYQRGLSLFSVGGYSLKEHHPEKKSFHYVVDGSYGEYDTRVHFDGPVMKFSCTCPSCSNGCKHMVAVCLDILTSTSRSRRVGQEAWTPDKREPLPPASQDQALPSSRVDESPSFEELKAEALERRKKSAQMEQFRLVEGETLKGEHEIINSRGKRFVVTLHEPISGRGHCTCPDFCSNGLNTCKHLLHTFHVLSRKKRFKETQAEEKFPFVHIYWDSDAGKPRCYHDRTPPADLRQDLSHFFDEQMLFQGTELKALSPFLTRAAEHRNVRIDRYVMQRVNRELFDGEMESLRTTVPRDLSIIRTTLYPYQQQGVDFALFKQSAILADEMGLGKTLQAITLALLKREIFGFTRALIITPASLKEQWKREIERFTSEKALVIAGNKETRQRLYAEDSTYFKITNYEAAMRDILAVCRYSPDLIILDEAQRIKNFETKTAEAIKSIPRQQALVITGTPLENKLEELYSIVQFADFELLTPLWKFAAEHFVMPPGKTHKILGYRNLEALHHRLKPLVIRRKREEVIKDLPEVITNTYYLDLTHEQREIHQGYLRSLLPILSKKYLTPLDVRRIQELLTAMRMVCDSTYLVDRMTNHSPKLAELEQILGDLVLENRRKVVIFTEWTTMTFLIGKILSDLGISFVEFTGKVPVEKRGRLIEEFRANPACMVFLSTDAGGVGLNLQNADCVINFELPWNPAKLNQRIGRVHRLGQESSCINVVNLVMKDSLEEKILAGIALKQELFDGVFDGTADEVSFSRERKIQLVNKIRDLLGEEPAVVSKESSPSEELEASTPGFLNPKVLDEEGVDLAAEEGPEPGEPDVAESEREEREISVDVAELPSDEEHPGSGVSHALAGDRVERDLGRESGHIPVESPAESKPEPVSSETVEEVLEHGMQFLSGLMAMAGKKPLAGGKTEKMVSVNRETGEVVLKFKLPGF